jgi:hypothetical protein
LSDTAAPQTLLDQSRETRRRKAPHRSYGDPVLAGFRQREQRQIVGLAYTAANLAAAERKRHGRDASADEKADAAQDALAYAYGSTAQPIRAFCEVHLVADRIPATYWQEGNHVSGPCYRCTECAFSGETAAEMIPIPTATQPAILADLVDPDRERVASFDGSRESLRPSAEMIAAAGASLDAAHKGRVIDPLAGGGDLLTAAAESREAAEARRSVAPQLVDPTVSPIPHPVADAMGAAGIWPDDPVRQAALDLIAPDLTSQDWQEAGEKGTPAAIRKRRERGRGQLDANPKARTLATLLAEGIEPTPAEQAWMREREAATLLEQSPDGGARKACPLIDQAWRTNQPMVHPLKVSRISADGQA